MQNNWLTFISDEPDDLKSSSASGRSEPYETRLTWRQLPKQTSASSRYALQTRLHTYHRQTHTDISGTDKTTNFIHF